MADSNDRDLYLENLREVLIECYKNNEHPVTYFMNEPGVGYLNAGEKSIINNGISVEDIFECFGIKEG